MAIYFVGCDMGGWHGSNDAYAILRRNRSGRLSDIASNKGRNFWPLSEKFCIEIGKIIREVEDAKDTRVVFAIDAALSWPTSFVLLANRARFASHVPKAGSNAAKAIGNPYLYRRTERFVREEYAGLKALPKDPLTAPGDKFGNNSSKAQALVAQLVQHLRQHKIPCYRPPYDAWNLQKARHAPATIVEVYPAGSMRSLSFKQLTWPGGKSMDYLTGGGVGKGDVPDAQRCAITAFCYARTVGMSEARKCKYPTVFTPADADSKDRADIRREGWIFFPKS